MLGLLVLQPALARKDDRNQPMNVVRADRSDGFNAPNSITTLTGNVVLTQGTMKVTGDVAKIYFDADQQVSRIVVTGKPAHIQQVDDFGKLMTGDALTLDYDNINDIAVLTTNASVHKQDSGEAHGDKLTYNTNTGYMTGDSGSNGVVHMIFLPKVKPIAGSPAKGAATPAGAPHEATPATAKPASASSTPATPVTVPAPANSSATPAKGQP